MPKVPASSGRVVNGDVIAPDVSAGNRGRLSRPAQRHLSVFFKEDKVARFERDNIPESAPQAPDEGAPISKFPKI